MKIKNIRTILSSIILCTLFSYFSGCDFLVDNSSTSVSGKIYYFDHIPVPNVKVSVQNQFVYTSNDGGFAFDGISSPYDLIISDSLNPAAAVYKGLSNRNITIPYNSYTPNNINGGITVHLPKEIVQSNLRGKIVFTDGNYINSYDDFTSPYSTVFLQVPVISNSVTGKLIALIYKTDSAQNIISYENYGESPDIRITRSLIDYSFDSAFYP